MRILGRTRSARRRPAYLRMLAGILVAYALIIGFGDAQVAGITRVVLICYLLWTAMKLRDVPRWRLWTLAISVAGLAVTVWSAAVASARVASGVLGAVSVMLIIIVIAVIVSTLIQGLQVDTATVLGVLCIYLLLALFFASLHQLLAAFNTSYLNGAPYPPSASDLLYFSVITITTVGYGDITPASQAARAVAVTEALVGQLYLVSVVAAVIGGWRATGRSQA